jgi:hypothetical protein
LPRACFAFTSDGFTGIGNEFRRGGLTVAGVSPFDRLLLLFIFGEVGLTDVDEDDDELAEELTDDEDDDEDEEEEEEEEDEDDLRFRLGNLSSGLIGDNDGGLDLSCCSSES